MRNRSMPALALDTALVLSASFLGTDEPGDTSEDLAIRDLAEFTAMGMVVTRVHARDADGAVRCEYRATLDQLLRYERQWGDPVEFVAEALWSQGVLGDAAPEQRAIADHLRRLWRERFGEEIWSQERAVAA